jgi:phosphomannomutase
MKNTKSVEHRDVLDDWTTQILRFTSSDTDFSKYRVVADGGNGVAGVFMTDLAKKAKFHLIPLFLAPDGNFPNHHPNPMLEKNREDAKNALLEQHADIACIFDGDADRVILLDETGAQVNSAVISAIIAENILSKNPKAKFIGNAVASHNFRDFVVEHGSEYIREKVGHVYIRETMMKDSSFEFAGEHSAHYFFRENYFMDSGIVAAMVFLDLLARSGKKTSDFIQKYKKYITLEETNFEVPDPK